MATKIIYWMMVSSNKTVAEEFTINQQPVRRHLYRFTDHESVSGEDERWRLCQPRWRYPYHAV